MLTSYILGIHNINQILCLTLITSMHLYNINLIHVYFKYIKTYITRLLLYANNLKNV